MSNLVVVDRDRMARKMHEHCNDATAGHKVPLGFCYEAISACEVDKQTEAEVKATESLVKKAEEKPK